MSKGIIRYTKADIEELVKEIRDALIANDCIDDVTFYYNDKQMYVDVEYDDEGEAKSKKVTVNDGVSPFDYFEYAAHKHILSMSFEGELYDVLNYGSDMAQKFFNDILEKWDLYYELGYAWNLSVYPDKGDIEEWEYTDYEGRDGDKEE